MQKEILTGFQKGRMSCLSDGSGFVFPYCHLESFTFSEIGAFIQTRYRNEKNLPYLEYGIDKCYLRNSPGNIYKIEWIKEETAVGICRRKES